ncbi:hypothetical protein SGLAM104S_07077 [Streptomyces glaucescens]
MPIVYVMGSAVVCLVPANASMVTVSAPSSPTTAAAWYCDMTESPGFIAIIR